MKISVIIPTLNEEHYLKNTVDSLFDRSVNKKLHQTIVVDTGSADSTKMIAQYCTTVLLNVNLAGKGRAVALNEGASIADGDVFLFLDADTILPNGFDKHIEDALKDPDVVGGAFEFSLDGPNFGLRVVEFINRIRYRVRNRFYGDQGLFVRADIFNEIGGFPEKYILETAYLCAMLKKRGKLKLINKKATSSPRRFLAGGIYRVLLMDIKIWFLDLIGLDVQKYGKSYWERNKITS